MTDVDPGPEPRLGGQCVPLTHRKPWLGSWALHKLGSDTDLGSRDRRNRSFKVIVTRPAPGLPKTLTPSKQATTQNTQQGWWDGSAGREAQIWCPASHSRTHMQKTQTDSQVVLWPPHRLYDLCTRVHVRTHTHIQKFKTTQYIHTHNVQGHFQLYSEFEVSLKFMSSKKAYNKDFLTQIEKL